MDLDDLTLLDRWSAGDTAAGNALFRRHFELVYRFFEHKADGEIDDLVQETFLACMKSREAFRRQSTFRTYLLAIARHVLFAYWRRKAVGRAAIDFDDVSVASLSTSAGTRMARHQESAALLAALRALPVDQQILLEMFYWEGLERSALAEIFDVAEATIGSRLFRARQSLQATLEGAAVPDVSDADGFDRWARRLRPDAAGT
ncbi:MAG: sigma-70 family RNA polymerase sigma factor [Kofleriaceae bacterium]|nr:sigma-70 family RNA polymerase sigma factor [Kofleriaceae bacterium]